MIWQRMGTWRPGPCCAETAGGRQRLDCLIVRRYRLAAVDEPAGVLSHARLAFLDRREIFLTARGWLPAGVLPGGLGCSTAHDPLQADAARAALPARAGQPSGMTKAPQDAVD